MKLILIRHGESAHNRGYKVAGDDNNLTTVGVDQAVRIGEKLVSQKVDAIYCSPAPRAAQTLDEILRLREDNMPIHLTSLIGPKMKSENYEKVRARVQLFLTDLLYDHEDGDTIAAVGHMKSIEMITFLVTGTKRRLENGEMVEVEVKERN